MSIPKPIIIPTTEDVCDCHRCLSSNSKMDISVSEKTQAQDITGLSFMSNITLRYYYSDASEYHNTAIILKDGSIKDITNKTNFNTIDEWVSTLKAGGSYYINSRNELDQELHDTREKYLIETRIKWMEYQELRCDIKLSKLEDKHGNKMKIKELQKNNRSYSKSIIALNEKLNKFK